MNALTFELLTWVAARARTYDETMNAWRTSCPRTPVWEDATSDGLVEVCPGEPSAMSDAVVKLTAAGCAALIAAAAEQVGIT